ncbi:MAG: response regulator [Halioglobus sp.]
MCSQRTVSSPASRILLVEDVDAMRMYIRLALEGHGVEVTEAADLGQAKACLRSRSDFTSILLDLELPDGHGLDLLSDLKANIPVIVLSADDSAETESRCQQAGCAATFSKNGKLRDLGKVIAEVERVPAKGPTVPVEDVELAKDYLIYLSEARIELQHAGHCRDFEAVRRISHRLRGTAVHFGYNGIGGCAKAVGLAIASGNSGQIATALDALVDVLLEAVGRHQFQ